MVTLGKAVPNAQSRSCVYPLNEIQRGSAKAGPTQKDMYGQQGYDKNVAMKARFTNCCEKRRRVAEGTPVCLAQPYKTAFSISYFISIFTPAVNYSYLLILVVAIGALPRILLRRLLFFLVILILVIGPSLICNNESESVFFSKQDKTAPRRLFFVEKFSASRTRLL